MAAMLEEQVGDSSRNHLANFQQFARELLREELLEKRVDEPKSASSEKRAAQLIQRKEKLLKEQIEAAVELELRKQLSSEPLGSVSISDNGAYVDSIRQRLKVLEDELVTVKSEHIKNCKLLECLHRGRALREKLFGAGDDIHASLNDNDTAKELTKHSELSEKLLQEAEEMRKMRSELIALRRERSQVQQQSRTLVESALSCGKPETSQNSADNSLQEDGDSSRLQRVEHELCLLRCTLQGLIVGSGVSWSEDEELLELTMKLGDDHHWR